MTEFVIPRSALQKILSPGSVAVIGASDDPFRIGGRPIGYMLSQGFQGQIWPVNPTRPQVQGLTSYASIDALPGVPDVAVVAVAASGVLPVIESLGQRGTGAAIVFSAGFAEAGPQGALLEQEMVASARRHGMRILGPNSLGMLNPRNGFYGSFVSSVELGFPLSGQVAVLSQSGAYGGHILALTRARGIGLSACVMTGNECDLSLGEMIQAMVEDDQTHVIAVYSEGIRDGASLMQALEAARLAHKPVVMMKVGSSEIGSAAAQSHTASIAGNDAITDAVLAEFGVVRATSTEHMLDVARLATRRVFPVSNSLGVLTVSGGAGVIISDAAEPLGLALTEMPQASQERLKAMLPFASPRNPVDTTAQFLNDMSLLGQFTDAVVEEGNYGSLLGFFTYTAGTPSTAPKLRKELKRVREKHPDRLFVLSLLATPEWVQTYEDDGFTVFEDPHRAVAAIAAMHTFGCAFARAPRQAAPRLQGLHAPDTPLNEAQAKHWLGQAGIQCAPEAVCLGADAAVEAAQRLGFPVVLKIVSPDILHKSEIGGVLLDVASAEQVRAGFDTLMSRARTAVPHARLDGVLVARQLSGGVECIMGLTQDPVFGPVAMFGLGGIFVEVLKDVVFHRCPFGPDVAETMIRSIRGAPLLLGARGRAPVDIAALAQMLSRLSVVGDLYRDQVQAIDLNPVLAMPQGQGAYAVDAVVEIKTQ